MKKAKKAIIVPVGYDPDKSHLLLALLKGQADADGQRAAIQYIVEDLCGMYSEPADLESSNATYYNLGKAAAGRAIIFHSKVDIFKLNQAIKEKK